MPLTVAQLVDQLMGMPADAPVRSVAVTRSGWFHDRNHVGVDVVDVHLDGDGRIAGVWLVGGTATTTAPPSLLTVRCACGRDVQVDEAAPWPEDHLGCELPTNG